MKIRIFNEGNEKTIELEPIGHSAREETWSDESGGEDADATAKLAPRSSSDIQRTPLGYLRYFGFENVERLGAGMVGQVFSADWEGRELAIKIVPKGPIRTQLPNGSVFKWSGEKEKRAYEGIKNARSQSKHIAKHFPLVYTIMQDNDHYYIVLERLTDEGPYAAVIDELFAGGEALVDPKNDLMVNGAWKDLSRRMFMYLKSPTSRNAIIDKLLENFSDEVVSKAKKWGENWFRFVGLEKHTQPRSYEMIDELLPDESAQDNFLDEFGNLKREFEESPWLVYFVLRIIKITKENDLQAYYMNYQYISRQFVELMRKGSPIGWMHEPPEHKEKYAGAGSDIGNVYKEAESLRNALIDLEEVTGLVGTDMHDKNVMMRPSDGAVVIVDVGLFKPREEINEEKEENNEYAICTASVGRKNEKKYKSCKAKVRKGHLDEALYEIDFDISSLKAKTSLNRNFWDENQLNSEIREKLLEIAKEFAQNTVIEGKIIDITLTGSLAGYNWHNKSDIDLHLLVNFKNVVENPEIAKDLMNATKNLWNENHKIMIHGHEVEIYVQDTAEDHHSTAIYSIKNKKWLAVAVPNLPELDYNTISKKAEAIAGEIEGIVRFFNRKDYEKAHNLAGKMKEKIKKLRSAGLEGDGVHSTENLAFKVLRIGGYMQKLRDLHDDSYDKLMSIGESSGIKIEIIKKYNEAWAVKGKDKEKRAAGFGSLAKPEYMVSMDMAGKASEAVKNGAELRGWDKYAQLVAEAYKEAPEETSEAADAFKRLGHHVLKNIKKVQSAYPVEFVDGQPYDSAGQMAKDINMTGIMKISKDFNQSEVFGEWENLFFRAVHDYYGHLKARGHEKSPEKITKFNLEGELKAYNHHLMMLRGSEMAKAVFTEVIGQACYFMYYGNFPDQKVFFLNDFDHENLGAINGYKIENGDLVSSSKEEKHG